MVQRTIKVTVVKAQDLAAMDSGGTSDPYIELSIGDECKVKTTVKKKTLNPEYNESFDMSAQVDADNFCMKICIVDWNFIKSDKPMGTAIFNMIRLKKGVASDVWIPMLIRKEGILCVQGSVHLQITPIDFGTDPNGPIVHKDFKEILDFLRIEPVDKATDIKNIMDAFNLMWSNMRTNPTTKECTVKPAGLHIENCLRKYYTLCFSDTPLGVDREGFKAALVDIAHHNNKPMLIGPLNNEENFNKLWENFEREGEIIPNLFSDIMDAKKLDIIDTMTFTPEESKDAHENFEEIKSRYIPKRNTILPLLQIFEVPVSTSIFSNILNLRKKFETADRIVRTLLTALFESYLNPGKDTVNETEFTEFIQIAIPAFSLRKFVSDPDSIKKLFEEVDKDKSGGIDRCEFNFLLELIECNELVFLSKKMQEDGVEIGKKSKTQKKKK